MGEGGINNCDFLAQGYMQENQCTKEAEISTKVLGREVDMQKK